MNSSKPWLDEPNYMEFWHNGLMCAIIRGPSGSWCGYAAVPQSHPLYKSDYWVEKDQDPTHVPDFSVLPDGVQDSALRLMEKNRASRLDDGVIGYREGDVRVNDLDVHGGLTYAADTLPTALSAAEQFDPQWWFGFDTSHFGDFSPLYDDPESEYNIELRKRLGGVWPLNKALEGYDRKSYRDMDYAINETRSLADQLAAIS